MVSTTNILRGFNDRKIFVVSTTFFVIFVLSVTVLSVDNPFVVLTTPFVVLTTAVRGSNDRRSWF